MDKDQYIAYLEQQNRFMHHELAKKDKIIKELTNNWINSFTLALDLMNTYIPNWKNQVMPQITRLKNLIRSMEQNSSKKKVGL
ncbi:hypothetical protein ACOMCU_00795 [Lysinibacillus sp. UGB7]|uniref:hypothetical protein n=1 Tax=Lysinibacillus sp. UGB7 TaxID=3411039 RepID=UPI003B8141ED